MSLLRAKIGSWSHGYDSARAAHGRVRETRHRPLCVGIVEPCAQRLSLGTASGSYGIDQIAADTRTILETLASIAGVMARPGIDQHVDLALGELVQPGGFYDPQPDCRMGGAKAVRAQAAEIE